MGYEGIGAKGTRGNGEGEEGIRWKGR